MPQPGTRATTHHNPLTARYFFHRRSGDIEGAQSSVIARRPHLPRRNNSLETLDEAGFVDKGGYREHVNSRPRGWQRYLTYQTRSTVMIIELGRVSTETKGPSGAGNEGLAKKFP